MKATRKKEKGVKETREKEKGEGAEGWGKV